MYCGMGVLKSFPTDLENARKSSVTRTHTVHLARGAISISVETSADSGSTYVGTAAHSQQNANKNWPGPTSRSTSSLSI
ncbi:hypothetical protein HJC23_001552 [Cyclotella cryptica]|uniref:Uncharacterized protein n=1 Tax=Cyclotella cryptica TaxID=29204 RepID=A0ABD3PXW6_9STRA